MRPVLPLYADFGDVVVGVVHALGAHLDLCAADVLVVEHKLYGREINGETD